jgi:hypothetical protein
MWFAAWVAVGAGYAFGLIEGLLGLPFLLVAIIGTAFLARRPSSMHGVAGVCSGLGLIPLYISFINRSGPGDICTHRANGSRCVSEVSPWPWLLIGALLVLIGFAVFVVHERRVT